MSYTPTFSGGSWVAGLPLQNLADRRQHYVARSSSDATTDTTFTVDLGVARAVRCVGLIAHNLSSAGIVRARGFTTATAPVVEWTTVGDGSWTAIGTPTRVAAAVTCDDGVPLDSVEDDSAIVTEGYYRGLTFTGDGTKYVSVRVKAGTATATQFGIYDDTAVAFRHRVNLAWSGGVPTATTAFGSGTITTTDLGGGVYRVGFTVPSVVAANANRMYAYATTTTAANTGTVYYGDVLAWDAATDQLAADSGLSAALPSGTDAEQRDGWNPSWIHVTDADATARYWRIGINDTTNPDTYIDIGRLVITGGIVPTINLSHGAELGWTDPDTTATRTDGAATVFNARRRRREARFLLENQSEADAFGPLAQLMHRAGTSGECLFIFDPADTTYAWQRQFLGTLRELSPVQFTSHTFHATPVAIREAL